MKTMRAELLRERLSYDPETGEFRNRTTGRVCGTPNQRGYLRVMVRGVRLASHRAAWLYVYGSLPDCGIDHINGIHDDNRISNLRPANQQENSANARLSRANTTGFKGVTYRKRDRRYYAQIRRAGRTTHLGSFLTAEDAHHAYCKAAASTFGEFARFG